MNARKNRWSRPIAALLALIMLLGTLPTVWATEGDGENGGTTEDQLTVAIGPTTTTIEVGESANISCVVSLQDAEVSWISSSDVVTVTGNQTGATVVGNKAGSATITATAEKDGEKKESNSITVTVEPKEIPTTVSISPSSLTLRVDGTGELEAKVNTQHEVVWGSDDPDIAKVSQKDNQSAIVTGVSGGTTTITATANGVTDRCTVTVTKAVTGVKLSASQIDVEADSPGVGLSAYVEPSDATNQEVKWSSSNTSIATVDSNGKVIGKKAGDAVITVETLDGGFKANCTVNVKPSANTPVTGVKITTSSPTVAIGKTITLTAVVEPSGATNKNVTWASNNTAIATVNSTTGVVTGVKAGTAIIMATTVDGNKTATCNVTVTGTVPVTGVTVSPTSKTISVGDTFKITPTVAPSNATNKAVTWSSDKPSVATVNSSSGTVTGKSAGTAKITATTADGSKTAVCTVTVSKTTTGTITYSVSEDEEAVFNDADFNRACKNLTGSNLDYVKFSLPSSSRGILYYDYDSSDSSNTKVSSSKSYYYTSPSPYLERVSFVPKSGYTGTVTIDYTGRDVNGTDITGTVEIAVGEGGDSGDIEYTTSKDTPVDMDDSDFNAYCKDENGYNFDYVQFSSLPASSKGVLYYDYSSSDKTHTKVKTSTKYYRSESPYLDDVTFVPDEDFTGTVTIPFTGYDTKGRKFSGDLVITVGSDEEITYTTNKNTAVDLIERDFVNYSKAQTNNSTFDYIQFTTLPSSTKGTLYYDYAASSKNNEKVTRTGKYYRTKDPALEDIPFVPASGYTGVVTIPFTGYSDSGRKFSGDLKITVGSGGNVTYTATAGQSVEFDDADFNAYCKDETGANLDFVQFTLPSSAQGTLYSGTKKATSSSTKYYRSSPSPYLDDVSFTPAKSNTTTIRIPFTGESVKGDEFSGTVVISYTFAPAVIKYTSNGSAVTFKAKDFSDVCTNRGGKAALSSVQFDMATTTNGKLYASYANGTGSTVNTSTSYKVSGSPSLGNVTFVPKSGYSGKVNLTYTGTDANGDTYRGTVEITVTPAAANTNFKDMGNHSWAASSVDFLSKSGIVTGVDTTHYGPEKPITRGDFVLMLYRAFDMKSSGKSSFSDVPQNSYYAEAVAAAKALGIATGSNGKFNPGAPLTRQDAMVLIQRTMSATGRPLTAGDTSILNSFKDRNRVSDYAANAVAALVRSGLIKGDDGKLNPTASISRAEMAVLLHRVLTM